MTGGADDIHGHSIRHIPEVRKVLSHCLLRQSSIDSPFEPAFIASTYTKLSRALKSNFLEDAQADVSRRILFMLWAGPLTAARIKQVLTDVDAREVTKTLKELVKEKKVSKSGQEYALLVQADRRVWDSWLARIDGMNNVLGNLADAVYGRFFAKDALAFARTLAFRVRPEDVDELQALYKTIFETITRLDSAAEGSADAVEINLSVLWSEKELIANNMTDTNTDWE